MKKLNGASVSVIGASHSKSGLCCQDSSLFFSSDKYALAVVADGHGSSIHFRSDRGSRYAIKAGQEAIASLMRFGNRTIAKKKDEIIAQTVKHIIVLWNQQVEADFLTQPFSPEEMENLSEGDRLRLEKNFVKAYGTTLLLTVCTDKFSFGLQIGDGDCLVRDFSEEIISPMPEDERLVFNVTTSLCGETAARDFRTFWLDSPIQACFLSTDGVRNSFSGEEYYRAFAQTVWDDFAASDCEEAKAELSEFLAKLSAAGSTDDVSVAFFVPEKEEVGSECQE